MHSQDPDLQILNIDIDALALAQSEKLTNALGPPYSTAMSFGHSSASDPSLYLRHYDVVYLAALVGSTQEEKENTLLSVVSRMSAGATLVVRSAERLRRLMYTRFDPAGKRVGGVLDVCLVVHPYGEVVNSVVVGRVR